MVNIADDQPALLIGTIIGNIYALLVCNMELVEHIVFLDTTLKDIAEFGSQPKGVSRIAVHPEDHSKLFILFDNSIVVFYNITSEKVLQTYKAETPITFMSTSSASKLLCSHDDGTYSLLEALEKEFGIERKRPYGGRKCTKTSKIISSKFTDNDEEFFIFSGGVPVEELDNRFTLSIFCSDKSLILDFDSAILDFCVFKENDASHILFILCEEEVVAIDLRDPIWRMLQLPFLHPIHSSPVTCVATVTSLSECAQNLLSRLAIGQRNSSNIFSRNNWAIKSGQVGQRKRLNNANDLQLVVTGHENGVVNVWMASELIFKPWISLNTALLMETLKTMQRKCPMKILSVCRPLGRPGYSTPTRMIIDWLAGQLLVYEGLPDLKKNMPKNEVLLLDMTSSEEGVQLNHRLSSESPIQARSVPSNYPPGFCLIKNTIAQLKPAVPVTSIAWDSRLEVLAAGSEFGYVICSPKRREVLLIKTLIPSADVLQLSNMDGPLSRFKSVKKSIRQSFRKKRCSNNETVQKFRSTEREIVQRSGNPNILVVKFQICNVSSSSSSDCESQHLFVGTHGSVVFIHAFHTHTSGPSSSAPAPHVLVQLQCPLVKEIRLQHQAPIVDIVYAAEGSSPTGAGRLFVFTEEQIRTFTVPGLKPSTKLRFTATEGSRIRRAAVVQLRSRIRQARSPESFIVFSTNRAELYLIPTSSNLKRQYRVQFSEPSDSTAIISATLSSDGQLFYLRAGGSEFERCSLDNRFHNNFVRHVCSNPRLINGIVLQATKEVA
uniref:Lethal giant larvae homologue 2 domain-containing protein n=1 Tax=Globodera rostochiensis TaxID=31243 RepID=A0A914H1R5_GLORO